MFPIDAAKTWIDFLLHRVSWDASTRAAVSTVLLYAQERATRPEPIAHMTPPAIFSPGPPDQFARKTLEALVSENPPEDVNWLLLSELALLTLQTQLGK